MFWLINALRAGKIKSIEQAITAFTNINGRTPAELKNLELDKSLKILRQKFFHLDIKNPCNRNLMKCLKLRPQ